MPEQLKELIKAIGIMTELWSMTYKNFIDHGYSNAEALTHTREFMAAFMIATMNQPNKNKEENSNG